MGSGKAYRKMKEKIEEGTIIHTQCAECGFTNDVIVGKCVNCGASLKRKVTFRGWGKSVTYGDEE